MSKGANAYDIYNLLAWAFEHRSESAPAAAALKESLVHSGSHHGAVGEFTIDEDGNSSYAPVRRIVKNGGRELVR